MILKIDHETNSQKTQVYDCNIKNFITVLWKDLKVGHIIKVERDEIVPADIIVLEALDQNHICYVDESSLTGVFDRFVKKKACNDTRSPVMKQVNVNDYIKNIKGKVLYKYWPNFEKVQDIEPNLIIVDKIKTIKANTTCYRYNTPISKNSNGLGVIECSIITDNPIDVNKSYCESNLTKTKEYFHGFQQSNDYGYAATLNNVGLDDSAVLNIVDLNGNLVNCINKLQN